MLGGKWLAVGIGLALILQSLPSLAVSLEKGLVAEPGDLSAMRSEKRVALVIGNAKYPGKARLRNPVNDARKIAAKLKSTDFKFEVIEVYDADQQQMRRAAVKFGQQLRDGGVGLLFYTGHGIQDGQENYLVPIDAQLNEPGAIESDGVALRDVLNWMGSDRTRLRIVILDACRDNPFAELTKSVSFQSGGLLPPRETPRGTFMVFATEPQKTAKDGDKDSSPFAKALLKALDRPDRRLQDVFNDVSLEVERLTNRQQIPTININSFRGDFYFKLPEVGPNGKPLLSDGTEVQSAELLFWDSIKNSNDQTEIEAFLKKFPSGIYSDLARTRLKGLAPTHTEVALNSITAPPSASSPVASKRAMMVTIRTSNLRAEPSLNAKILRVIRSGQPLSITGEVEVEGKKWYRYEPLIQSDIEPAQPGGFINQDNVKEVSQAEWQDFQKIRNANQIELWQKYLEKYPNGFFATQAAEQVALLSAPTLPPHATVSIQPKILRDCDDCPELVVVPKGSFLIGSAKSEQGRSPDEGPQQRINFAQPFAMARYEVTFAEWDACAHDGGCEGYLPEDEGWGRNRRPVINVSWNDIQSYLSWISAKTGYEYNLPSEAQWEYAARGGKGSAYWWGNKLQSGVAICDGCNKNVGTQKKMTQPVGSVAANPFGLFDMSGNVYEWVADHYHDTYQAIPKDGKIWLVSEGGYRVLRGGSWSSRPVNIRSAVRGWEVPRIRLFDVGFRVVRKL